MRDLASGEVTQEIEIGPDSASGDESRLVDVGTGFAYLKQQVKGEENERLEAVDLESGEVGWEHDPEGRGDLLGIYAPAALPQTGSGGDGEGSSLHVAGNAPIVQVSDTSDSGRTSMLDAESGDPMWSLDAPAEASWSVWAVNGRSVASARFEIGESCARQTSYSDIDAKSAAVVDSFRSSYTNGVWECHNSNGAGTTITGDGVFAQDDAKHPQLIEWNGKPLWTSDATGEPIVYSQGVAVYHQLPKDGRAHAVDVNTDRELWSTGELTAGDNPTPVGDSLLIRSDGTKALDIRNGSPQWYYPDGSLIATDGHQALFITKGDTTTLTVANLDAAP